MAQAMPNFFVVGAMKAGTTVVNERLSSHPDVYCSPIKEPNFFSDDIDVEQFSAHTRKGMAPDLYVAGDMETPIHHAYVRDPATYRALFRKVSSETAIGECSTSYLYSKVAAKNIKEAVPDARIIILLRNPVDRAISHYLMDCRIGSAHGPLGEVLDADLASTRKGWGISRLYVELGLYTRQIERYLRRFPEDRVKIVIFDDLKRDFDGTMRGIAEFLEVDPDLCIEGTAPVNRARVPRVAAVNVVLNRLGIKEKIVRNTPERLLEFGKRVYYRDAAGDGVTEADRERLRAMFADEVESLSRLLGRDLRDWVEPAPADHRARRPGPAFGFDRPALPLRR